MPETRKTDANWDEIKVAYVTGSESLRQLAKRFGISTSQVMDRSRREGWVKEREQFRSRSVAESKERAAEAASEASALVWRIAATILKRFLAALEEGGIELTPRDAATWANIIMQMEASAAQAQAQQQIVVHWVAEAREE